MTGYHITPGYISGYSSHASDLWTDLKALALEICNAPERIAQEAHDFDLHKELAPLVAMDYAMRYEDRTDATIRFIEPEEEWPGQIVILASGGGNWRTAKEHVARAFVRLLMAEAHRAGLEISVVVA